MNRMNILEYAIGLADKEMEEEIKSNNTAYTRFDLLRGLKQGLEIANIIMTENFPDENMRNLVRELIEKYS